MDGSRNKNHNARLYWVHAITPLHVGAGRGIGFVDLPIMREKTTGWPFVPGSSVKGVWRNRAEDQNMPASIINAAFGSASDQEDGQGGSVVVTDAHIVLLPIRSIYGTFAYCTSTLALSRIWRDAHIIGSGASDLDVSKSPADRTVFITQCSAIAEEGQVFLEDLDFAAVKNPIIDKWAEWLGKRLFPSDSDAAFREILKSRLAIVPDNSFTFLSQQGTEVNARVRIDAEKKTVATGALWYEESLPSETVLAGLVWCESVRNSGQNSAQLLNTFCSEAFTCQVGGKATTGKGMVRCLFSGGD